MAFAREIEDGNLYRGNIRPDILARAFVRHVRIFELEPHNYCNRNCSFCSNRVVARYKNRECDTFPIELFNTCLRQLGEIGYAGQIRFSRYAEALYRSEIILEMLQIVKDLCPRAKTMIISNGDFLDRRLLDQLRIAHLDRLHLSIYFGEGETWNLRQAEEKIRKTSSSLGLDVASTYTTGGEISSILYGANISVTANSADYHRHGFDRGGMVKELVDQKYHRISPCMQVFHNFTVDYNGTVMPCCNLRSDFADHTKFALGRLTGSDKELLSIYGSIKATRWRKQLSGWGVKSSPCRTCKQLATSKWLSPFVARRWPRNEKRLNGPTEAAIS
jgi:radical SAM protein with 4Fe4S-binding SPASM domain